MHMLGVFNPLTQNYETNILDRDSHSLLKDSFKVYLHILTQLNFSGTQIMSTIILEIGTKTYYETKYSLLNLRTKLQKPRR